MPSYQSGFRHFRSTQDNLFILVRDIQMGFARGFMTDAVFLDIASAFDRVKPDVVCAILSNLKLP